MKGRLAWMLMRWALRLGAKPPPHLMLQLLIDGRPMIRCHDREAHMMATLEGGQLRRQFKVQEKGRHEVPISLVLTALERRP